MTHAERLRLFRPATTLGKLERTESELVQAALNQSRIQAESLRIQYDRGTRPASLMLDKNLVERIALAIGFSIADTFLWSRLAITEEIAEAKRTRHDGKPAVFAEPDNRGKGFYPEVGVEWYREYGLRLAGVQQQAALDAAKRAVIRGVEEGLPHRQVMRELAETFTDFSRNRLEMIARTETAKIFEQARWRSMDAESEIVGYEWSAIMDTRTCPICRPRNHMRFPKDKIQGRLPPAHVNCRCLLLPIFSWELDSGEVEYTSWPRIPNQPGFGTTSMEIPA